MWAMSMIESQKVLRGFLNAVTRRMDKRLWDEMFYREEIKVFIF